MAISIGDLQIVLSGGAANTSQAASLGGAISTAGGGKVVSQNATAPSSVTGVTILDAMGNAEGVGILKWDNGLQALLWKPFGGVTFDGPVITTNGVYTLGTTNGYMVVNVVFASLPVSTLQDSITISAAVNKVFDNISALESLNGDVEYRCLFVKNTHASQSAFDVRLWIKNQPVGSDTLALCLDANGKNAAARGPLVNEEDTTNVLTGYSFVSPSTYAAALVFGTLAPGDYYPFWVRRNVPLNTTVQVANDYSALALSSLI